MSNIVLARRALVFGSFATVAASAAAQTVKEIRIDWATYNPVSLVLKSRKILEDTFAGDGIAIVWVQSAGSNKALEFLNASSLDFGSTAGAAALIGRINGNPIKSIYVYSKPEWTALVTKPTSGIKSVADLKGTRVAATRGTDPHIFLVRALADYGLTEKDVVIVPLQHADGRLALQRGDVDAWAGLDPILASAEIDDGDVIFFRKPDYNSWGVLNVRESFAAQQPALVKRVLAAYEKARLWARENPKELAALLVAASKLPEPVINRQLERTDLSYGSIGPVQKAGILAAGVALQKVGVIAAEVDVPAQVDALIDSQFLAAAR